MGSFIINKKKTTILAKCFALFNINKQRSSFNKVTSTRRNKQLCLKSYQKRTEWKNFVYKNKINKQKPRALLSKPT